MLVEAAMAASRVLRRGPHRQAQGEANEHIRLYPSKRSQPCDL